MTQKYWQGLSMTMRMGKTRTLGVTIKLLAATFTLSFGYAYCTKFLRPDKTR